jgi:hypothetical protein
MRLVSRLQSSTSRHFTAVSEIQIQRTENRAAPPLFQALPTRRRKLYDGAMMGNDAESFCTLRRASAFDFNQNDL